MIYRVETVAGTEIVHADGFYTESVTGCISFYRRGFPEQNDVRYTHYLTGVIGVRPVVEDDHD